MRTYGVKGSFSNTIDVDVIKRYNEEIAKTSNGITAYYRALSDGNGNIIQCNKATRDLIASQNGAAVSTEALKQAQDAASKSGSKLTGIMKTLKGALINFGIMLAIEGIIALVKFTQETFFPTVKQLKEELSETTQEIADLHSEQESLNSELETTRQRIAELKAQGTLTFTEEAELTRLQKENAELERKLELTKANKAASESEFEGNFLDAFNSDYGDKATFNYQGRRNWLDKLADALLEGSETRFTAEEYTSDLFASYEKALSGDKAYEHNLDKYKERINDVYEDYQGYLKQLEDADYSYGTNEQIDAYIDQINEFNDKYLVAFGNTENLFAQIYSRDKYSEARTAIEELATAGNLTAESLQGLYNQDENVKQFYDDISKVFGYDTSNIDEQTAAIKKQADAYNALVNGNVDYNKRPLISPEKMKVVYPEFEGEVATTYDMDFGLSSNITGEILYTVKATPILEDGTVLDQNSLDKYIYEELQPIVDNGGSTEDLLAYDKAHKNILINVDVGETKRDSEGLTDLDKKLGEIKNSHWEATKQLNDNSGFENFANELNKVEEAADEAETSFKSIAKTLADGLDKLSNKKDILSEVKEELDSFGAISADNISKILEQFSDNDDVQKAVAYYLSGIGTAQQVYDAMAKGYQNDLKLQAQTLASKMQNDEKYYESIGGTNQKFIDFMSKNYGVDLSNCKTLAQAKLQVENQLIQTLKNNWSKYWNASSKSIQDEYRRVNQIYRRKENAGLPITQEWKEYYNAVVDAYKSYTGVNSAMAELDNLTLKSFNATGFNSSLSTDFGGSEGKTEAEKYFDKLKYKLETNQITQEQYLKDLDWGYKHFYNKTADYLEDYAKYSQEVYDGFKDMYKEDLEAQKEAWEEKKDEVSEYYDNLREQIKDAHDEEDYEKEQSEKRKEIFDLDMQIAELMRDGSEKAKARIAELEEERLKAEEELLDFETDKAREDELFRLEKEQEAEEKKIQDQIDTIDKELETIDKDIVSVRSAIINYAAKKGITLDFAYASGTRSSVGGFGRINEKGIEMISAPDGNGNYIPMLPNSYVFSAKATEFLWKLATEHSLPQAMYNSIAKSIKTQSSTPSVNIAQPITITMGDVIIKGNADKQTVADIKKQQENTVRMVLQKIKELQK